MSAALPEAFGRHAGLFAVTYVALQVGRNVAGALLLERGHPLRAVFERIVVWSIAAGVLWIAGAFLDGDARLLLWVPALGIELVAPLVGYRTPGRGMSRTADYSVDGGHFAERCQGFVIIALGESIVVTGATASSLVLDFANGTALMVAFGTSAALWWLYFDEVGWRAQRFLSQSHDSGRLARDAYTYLHIPIVAGIIVVAVGDELVIAHPGASPSGVELAVILGGPVLYLVGHTLFRLRMIHNVSRKRVVATVALLALAPLGSDLTSLGLAACVFAILAVLAGAETRHRLSTAGEA
jgi:low temperature requirement protein LtrA